MAPFAWKAEPGYLDQWLYHLTWSGNPQAFDGKFQQLAQYTTFDSPSAYRLYRRKEEYLAVSQLPLSEQGSEAEGVEQVLDRRCVQRFHAKFAKVDTSDSQVTSSTSASASASCSSHFVPALEIDGIHSSPLDLVFFAAERFNAALARGDLTGNDTATANSVNTKIRSQIFHEARRQWAVEATLCENVVSPLLEIAQGLVNAVLYRESQHDPLAAPDSPPAAPLKQVAWLNETQSPENAPALQSAFLQARKRGARWDYALFDFEPIQGTPNCQNARIVAVVEVKRRLPANVLQDLLALANTGVALREGLGRRNSQGEGPPAHERLLAQIVSYCAHTGVRTGAIFTGSVLLVVDLDGEPEGKMKITLRTPVIASPHAMVDDPQLQSLHVDARSNLPSQLTALILHALQRMDSLGARTRRMGQSILICEPALAQSGLQNVNVGSSGVRYSQRLRNKRASGGDASGSSANQGQRVDAFAMDSERSDAAEIVVDNTPLFDGASAGVHKASFQSASNIVAGTNSMERLLAKLYDSPTMAHHRDADESEQCLASHEIGVYSALRALQGRYVPHLFGLLRLPPTPKEAASSQPEHVRGMSSSGSSAGNKTPPPLAVGIETPPLTASPSSSKGSTTATASSPPKIMGLLLEDVGQTLASLTFDQLEHLLLQADDEARRPLGSQHAEISDWVKAKFIETGKQLHGHGVLHRDIRAANMCLRVQGGSLQALLIDFHLAAFTDPLRCKEECKRELGKIADVVEHVVQTLFARSAEQGSVSSSTMRDT
ncbi:hypothetical protein IE81DRAFT_326938 [Ceraceosorus guamensis]|uniref:Uncharacterized protein n=1 Tax=Ceraceosorus guamensis TaxID=1522189 RepID=A0A316VRK9_9BASI|nr:hypothetical protein IE81DRAFT_326938 [Ceraceosorus guamensis]PWN39043.1 hypothetical protein IE81DRAFT_326938 [Ceraceosorus guamensis]